jgi:hypothetical protein
MKYNKIKKGEINMEKKNCLLREKFVYKNVYWGNNT